MASEIQVAFTLTFAKSGIVGGSNLTFTADWAGAKYNRTVQALSTSEEAINLGEATGGGGFVVLRNLDASIAIHIRQATAAANFATINAGQFMFLRWSTATTAPFAVAASGTPSLEVLTLVA